MEERLSGSDFAALLRAGHGRLKQNVHIVNSLNIFPVPDGDTGTNMELSLAAGVTKLAESKEWKLGRASQALASGLLMGARGNSGVILSQLFRGFSKTFGQSESTDQLTFAAALQDGVQIAYRAVAKPVEGTILTVAREAAAVAVKEARRSQSWGDWMEQVYLGALRALENTPNQLAVLKQAGVVDSGGQGLVFIYEGFLQFFRGENLGFEDETAGSSSLGSSDFDFAAAHIQHEGEFGYCTEVLIRLDGREGTEAENSLRQCLGTYGDSLLVVGAEDLLKVHVHTLEPGRVLTDAQGYGTLVKIKIDNMTEQHTDIQVRQATVPEQAPSILSQGAAIPTSSSATPKPAALIVVAAGEGLKEVFLSLGADVVVEGGQTMNPSTQEIVAAIESVNSDFTIVLPNNKNIVMAAQQAAEIIGKSVKVVASNSVPEGIAAMIAYHAQSPLEENLEKMKNAAGEVHSGQVVRAVRDSVYQGRAIKANQYLGFVNQDLSVIGEARDAVASEVIEAMVQKGEFELLTIFYGEEITQEIMDRFKEKITEDYGLEVEARYGGQPIYDYIFALE